MLSNNLPDPFAVLADLGIYNPSSVKQISGGNDTAMWLVKSADVKYALRILRHNEKKQFQAEQTAIELAEKANLPVPKIVAKGIFNEFPAILLSWCPGVTLAQQLFLKPWLIWKLGMMFGRMQAKMHTITALPNIFHFVTDWISWKTGDDIEIQKELKNITQNSSSLIHLDFHHYNIVVEGKKISGIIDWSNARLGDPRADFARTSTMLRVEPWGAKTTFVLSMMRWLFEKAWRRGYIRVSGSLTDMALFYAWAGVAMTNDLAPRVEQPESWFQQKHLEKIRSWTNKWKKRAGIPVH